MKHTYLNRTHYFSKTAIWVRRFLIALLLVTPLFIWELEASYEYLKYSLTLAIIATTLLWRIEDIAVDETHFYHLKTSLLPRFSTIRAFRIDELKSIRWKGYESWLWAYYRNRSMKGLDHGIEMSFKDNSSVSLDVNIYKSDLNQVLNMVKHQMKKNEL